MGFIDRLFKKGRRVSEIVKGTQGELFSLYGIEYPTNAQKIRLSVYLCIAGIAIIKDLARGVSEDVSDKIVVASSTINSSLLVRVNELSDDADELSRIISFLAKKHEISESTRVNGFVAFEAMFIALYEQVAVEIVHNNQGPFGSPGYASVVISERVFGKEESAEKFIHVYRHMIAFTKDLLDLL